MNNKQTNKLKGFTLLELMVAMGIMAILIGLSLVGIQTVQRSLRNTQRQDALKTVNLEIQGYFNDNGELPALGSDLVFGVNSVTLNGAEIMPLKGATKGLTGATQSTSSATVYCYFVNASEATYGLAVHLENKGWFQMGSDEQECTSNSVVAGN